MHQYRKVLLGFVSLASAIALAAGLAGCNPWGSNNEEVIANQLGVASAITWVSIDKPDIGTVADVATVVGVIRDSAANVSAGQSYYLVLGPVVHDYVATHVSSNMQMIVELGGSWVLSGIDTMLAVNPEWVSEQNKGLKVVKAYCSGVLVGLELVSGSLADSDGTIRAIATHENVCRGFIKAGGR